MKKLNGKYAEEACKYLLRLIVSVLFIFVAFSVLIMIYDTMPYSLSIIFGVLGVFLIKLLSGETDELD